MNRMIDRIAFAFVSLTSAPVPHRREWHELCRLWYSGAVMREQKTSDTVRFGVSMDKPLVEMLDQLTADEGYSNRSETLRSLVRQEIIRSGKDSENRRVAGVITLVYRYGTKLRRVSTKDFSSLRIAGNMQLHLDEDICLKLLILTGDSGDLHAWAQKLVGQRGVIGKLSITATEDVYRELTGTGA